MSNFKNKRSPDKPYCRLDWDPDNPLPSVPDKWRRNLAAYAVYLWTAGNGNDLSNPRIYSEKRLIGTYVKRIRPNFMYTHGKFEAPSLIDLIDMAKQTTMLSVQDAAREILDHCDLSDEALGILIFYYKKWDAAKRPCA